MEYQKINTLFLRDEKNIIMPNEPFVQPEFEYLRGCKWDATEKIDGTNIRIEVSASLVSDGNYGYVKYNVDYKGRTDNANIPKHLLEFLKTTYPAPKVLEALGVKQSEIPAERIGDIWVTSEDTPTYTIYGEGYGVKIQSGGNYIKDGVGFIVFDVKVNKWWLQRDAMLDIAEKLGAPTVPYLGQMTIDEAIDFVRTGFKSKIAQNPNYDAEGLVLKTPCGLYIRKGERLIVKVKTCDFVKYKNAYGDGTGVVQKRNPKYKEQ